MKLITLATTLLVLWPVYSMAQDTEPPPSSPGQRTVTILGGIGSSMGGLGFQAERYFRHERFSVFGGLGYTPSYDIYPSYWAVAAGARAYITTGKKHRALLELSVSMLSWERWTDGEVGLTRKQYGPGLQVGYQYMARGGFTFMGSIGLGYAFGRDPRISDSPITPMIALGAGYTWR